MEGIRRRENTIPSRGAACNKQTEELTNKTHRTRKTEMTRGGEETLRRKSSLKFLYTATIVSKLMLEFHFNAENML